MIVQVSVVLRRTVCGDNLSGSHQQSQVSCELSVHVITLLVFLIGRRSCDVFGRLSQFTVHLTLMMTYAQVVETSVNVTTNSPSQDYTHLVNHNLLTYFKFCVCNVRYHGVLIRADPYF